MSDLDDQMKTAAELLTALQEERAVQRKKEREERWAEERKQRAALAERLAAEWLSNMPKSLTDTVFEYAWEQGHNSGTGAVRGAYEDVAALVALAWDEGQKR